MLHPKHLSLAALALLAASGTAGAAATVPEDHAAMTGPFATPMDVTKACLECHEDAAKQIMATSHWTWAVEQELPGRGKVVRGKINAVNNFCIALPGNWPRCTSCHIGYGWKDANFDFKDESRVDCLACHDTTGAYKKFFAGAGMPQGFTGNPMGDKEPVDLVKVAQKAGKPTRVDCLKCHAFGGGGNAVKHGDIDKSLMQPTRDVDVHMATDGGNFTCQECHKTKDHQLPGRSLIVTPTAPVKTVSCTDCHKDTPHEKSKVKGVLNKHAKRVACQTCHIPVFAKVDGGTKMSWDWSQAKHPKDLPEDQRTITEHGHVVYSHMKGRFTYQENVIPTYLWYNGTAGAYLLGDKIDPSKVTDLNRPAGAKDDSNSRIMPFKVHQAVQPYDSKFNYLIAPKVFGPKDDPDAFWQQYDWTKAATAGMKAAGLEFSGQHAFARTATYWPTNHMVSPADKALKCKDCHGAQGRMDWKSLGYDGDPKAKKEAKAKK